jgi:anti-anti-sigma factor
MAAAISGLWRRMEHGQLQEQREMSTSKCFALERMGDTLVVVLGHHIMVLQKAELVKERSAFIEEIQDPTIRAVVIDFSSVEYFGSILLDILCQAWKQLRQRGPKMALCNLNDISHEIITCISNKSSRS